MIKTYRGLKGLTILLLFLVGIVVLFTLFFWGVTKAVEFLLPTLKVTSYVLIVLFTLGVLPLSFIKNIRPRLSKYCLMMSNILGVTTWMASFLFVMTYAGFWGILLCFLFKFLAPVAIIGAIFKSSWDTVGNLMLWIIFTYLMRLFSQRVLTWGPVRRTKSDVIDAEIVS